jgi:hypothetical protein
MAGEEAIKHRCSRAWYSIEKGNPFCRIETIICDELENINGIVSLSLI